MRAADPERLAAQFPFHRRGFVVIAGYAKNGLPKAAEDAAKAQISGRIVLHEIAGGQDGGIVRHLVERGIEHRAQARIGLDAAQLSVRPPVQVGVRDVKDVHGRNRSKPPVVYR